MFVFKPEERNLMYDALSSMMINPGSSDSQEYPSKFHVDRESGTFHCCVLVPGFESSDISATYENGNLTISGYSKNKDSFWKNSFKKKFAISEDHFDLDTATFEAKNGVLSFSIEKAGKNSKEMSFQIK